MKLWWPLGPIAQWLEQATHNRLVGGSNPSGPTEVRFPAMMLDEIAAGLTPVYKLSSMPTDEMEEAAHSCDPVPGPSAEAVDPVLELLKQGLDLSLVEKNLRLTTEQRAQQLVNATRFIGRFRPLVPEPGR